MIPLSLAPIGRPGLVVRVGGNEKTRRFLENLGFVPGAAVTPISTIGGNVIVLVKDSRIAIDREMASKILL